MIKMQVAGELVGMLQEPELPDEQEQEIEQLLDHNFPREKLSKLKTELEDGSI